LPVGISGLIIAAIFAASMAVMSAGINSLTTATIVDFYQRMLRPGRSPEHYAMAGRVGTALWGTAATLLALHAGRLGALALAYNKVSSYLSGPLLGIFLLATLTRRANSAGVLMGAAAGSVVVAYVAMTTEWSFFWYGPIGVVVTFATGYSASLLGPARRLRASKVS
jgi:sodium-coupled monocarboxylate transporter 8/12